MDPTAHQRIKKQRDARTKEGWAEVRVWVPTKSDAEEVQKLAAQLREKAQGLEELNQLEGVQRMHHSTHQQIKDAIAQQGSAAYITQSGAVQTLLSELARDGYIVDFAKAFVLFARAHPSHANIVEQSVPSKIMNHFWIRNQQIDAGVFLAWEGKHSDWAETLMECVRNPVQFELTVNAMLTKMKQTRYQ
jgi:hypothetical protein